nr:hypothetical protein [uncultured Dyadobacter sp.]
MRTIQLAKDQNALEVNKVITYSLLAHINNTGTLKEGLIDVFVPIVKRSLSSMSREGVVQGKNISEIQHRINLEYGLDMPIPVLKNILINIQHEPQNKNEQVLTLYIDGAFRLNEYFFYDYEETIDLKQHEIETVEKYFIEFCKIHDVEISSSKSVFHFIEKNKYSISRYLSANGVSVGVEDTLVEAQFINYFRAIPQVYQTIKDIYLGSIISTYIEYKTQYSRKDVELVFDTNFVIGLLDLNTPESTHTCNKLVEIGVKSDFKLTVLDITLEECRKLLRFKTENYKNAVLQRKVNPEDIYSASERRNLTRSDLERISDNLEILIENKGISIVPNTTKYRNIARYSSEYRMLKEVRSTEFAALHDATALHYVSQKRGSRAIKNFEDVNCWFVHNSVKSNENNANGKYNSQPENIKADDLLNILWLANPGLTSNLESMDLAEIGITSLISCTFNAALPRASIIKELDDNIQKYQNSENAVTEKDLLLIATRISHRSMKNIEDLNELAQSDANSFLAKLKEEADAQRHEDDLRADKVNKLIDSLEIAVKKAEGVTRTATSRVEAFEIEKIQLESKNHSLLSSNSDLLQRLESAERKTREMENNERTINREKYIKNKIRNWRLKSLIPIIALTLLYITGQIFFDISSEILKIILTNDQLNNNAKWGFIGIVDIFVNGVFIKLAYDRFFNESWRSGFVNRLKIPNDFQPLQ